MKKLILGVSLGLLVGLGASAMTRVGTAKHGGPCGSAGLVCAEDQECCVSPGPSTHRCVKPGTCKYL